MCILIVYDPELLQHHLEQNASLLRIYLVQCRKMKNARRACMLNNNLNTAGNQLCCNSSTEKGSTKISVVETYVRFNIEQIFAIIFDTGVRLISCKIYLIFPIGIIGSIFFVFMTSKFCTNNVAVQSFLLSTHDENQQFQT